MPYTDEFTQPSGPPGSWDLIGMPETRQRRAGWVRALAEHSYMFDAAVDAYERYDLTVRTVQHYKDIHDPARNGPGLAKTFALIERMKAEAVRHQARFVVAIFPIFYRIGKDYPFKEQHDYVARTLRERGIDVIDLRSAYDGYRDEQLWVHPIDHHPNDLAHRLAAQQIEAWLRAQKILPP